MDVDEQIKTFREFVEQSYYPDLLENVRKGKAFLILDFSELIKFNTEICEEILENPEELLKAAELAIKEFDLPRPIQKFSVRLKNLPESQKVEISNIRSKHLNKLIIVEGIVRQKSDVRPHVTAAKFECPSCGNILNVLQLDKKYKEPSRCGCGRKGKFKEISKELVDGQGLVLEESPEELDGTQPKRINIFLKDDLVSPISERKSSPGSRVRAVGWLTEVPITLRTGGQATKYDLIIEANYVEPMQDDDIEMTITEEEKQQIMAISHSPDPIALLTENLAPSIYGHEKIKEALILQLAGGSRKIRPDGVITRGDIHLMLIGDPGSAKSQLLKRISKIAPKARFTSGKGATAAGLCVSPNSKIMTHSGEMETIQEVVESRLHSPEQVYQGVWKKEDIKDIRIQSMSNNLKLHTRNPQAIWKLRAPKEVFKIRLDSGKTIELTGNTKLLTINEDGNLHWIKSSELSPQMFIACPRKLIGGDVKNQYVVDLFTANPVVHGVEQLIKIAIPLLKEKYGSIRQASRHFKINENNLYHNWINPTAKGRIKLKKLKDICEDLGIDWKKEVSEISLYNGKKHKLPCFLSADFLHVCGLIAGDGDLRKNNLSYSIRLSNSDEGLLWFFQTVLENDFSLHCDVQKGNHQRPAAARTNSKIVGEILLTLGIPLSPKSNRLLLSNTLLHFSDNLLAAYLGGLYDSDGSVITRDSGSDSIELVSCSEEFMRQIQLVLLRFEIHSILRKKNPSTGKIKGNYTKWILTIYSQKNIKSFFDNIPLRHGKKKEKLLKILAKNKKEDTNKDTVPNITVKLKALLQHHQIPLKKVGFHKKLSRRGLQQLLQKLPSEDTSEELATLANSDIFWEKVKEVRSKNPDYTYVYDLTVKDSHNFVVDGILVHNTASVVKDEFLGGWSLEAGTLVLANKGFAIIDEMDKMGKDDRSALHEGMEQQQISISKANIQATLRCETTIIAAANPKFGRFDPYDLIANQINLPPTLINRFDLIFPIKDLPNREKDEQIASFILKLHQDPKLATSEISTDLLKKFFAFIRQKMQPRMSDEAIQELKDYYITMRNSGASDEAGIKSIPITARQLEALIRLAEASAKIRMSLVVSQDDAKKSIGLIDYCLNQIAKDMETGQIDIDRIGSRITATQRSGLSMIKEIIHALEEQQQVKIIPVENIIEAAREKNFDQATVEDILEKLRRSGDIFEPKRGFVQRL